LRDWVTNGDGSPYAMSDEAFARRVTPQSASEMEAEAVFKLAVSYHRPAAASPPVTTAYHALQSQVAQARWKAFLSRQGTPG